ncbi:hypothetical protein VKT23_012238 [Stygiomarasmius scandens]|uniref:Uncharacterized protein n=1 Tax=Marasmiellus scandens TaxID=2682957 RepID=A0ABR1JBC3_9AGAR
MSSSKAPSLPAPMASLEGMDAFLATAKAKSIENEEDAAKLLCSLMKATRKYLNPHSRYATSDWYLEILKENAKLYAATKDAREKSDFETLANNDLLQFPSRSWDEITELADVKKTLETIESEGRLQKVVRGEEHYETWRARNLEGDPSVVQHFEELKIPTTDGQSRFPSIILHELGSFRDDAVLQARLANIFHAEHTFLVNCSGTGKTRLIFEGLCSNWGFYFICEPDSSRLGSSEIFDVIAGTLRKAPGFRPFVKTTHESESNRRMAHRQFSEVLLSRLLIFKLFLKYAMQEGIVEDHKKRWLLAQLSPGILWGPKTQRSHDYFVEIRSSLHKSEISDDVIDDAILQTLREIIDIWDFTKHPFYVVLDEANLAATTYPGSFRDDGGDYPLLKEILRIWRKQLGHLPVSFIMSGTRIPRVHFEFDHGEWDTFHWCSDTGYFDDREVQQKYVSDFLPTPLLSSPEGEELLDRIWKWLRGRHRFTAGFITILLQKDFVNPHISLSLLVRASTHFEPKEGLRYSVHDVVDDRNYYKLSVANIKDSNELVLMMYEAVLHNLCCQTGTRGPEPVRVDLVKDDHGHFSDTSAISVAVDEPLVLIAATYWFESEGRALLNLDYFNDIISSSSAYKCQPSFQINFIALSLAVALSEGQPLSTIFTFADSAPSWSNQTAELVHKTNRSFRPFHFFSEDQKLVESAASLSDLANWLKSHKTPFLSYQSGGEATLLFALKLGNKRHIWVTLGLIDDFIQKDKGSLDTQELRTEVLKLENLFRSEGHKADDIVSVLHKGFKHLPKRFAEVGTLGLVCVSACLGPDINVEEATTYTTSTHSVTHLNRKEVFQVVQTAAQSHPLVEYAAIATGSLKINLDSSQTTQRRNPRRQVRGPL